MIWRTLTVILGVLSVLLFASAVLLWLYPDLASWKPRVLEVRVIQPPAPGPVGEYQEAHFAFRNCSTKEVRLIGATFG
jgi:hypothetical protein